MAATPFAPGDRSFTFRCRLNASPIQVECVAYEDEDGLVLDQVYLVEPNGSVGPTLEIEDLSAACQAHLLGKAEDEANWLPRHAAE